jgi:hypothetical protein
LAFLPAFCFQTPSAYASPSNWENDFTLIQNCRQYISLCFNFYIFGQQKQIQNILDKVIADISSIQSALYFS